MLPNSRTVKFISVVFGVLPSFLFCVLILILLLPGLLSLLLTGGFTEGCDPTDSSCFNLSPPFATVALLGFYGTVALWRALFDASTANRSRRTLTVLGLVAGIAAATSVLISFWQTLVVFAPVLLFLIGMILVGTYHLIRLIQYEVRSRTVA